MRKKERQVDRKKNGEAGVPYLKTPKKERHPRLAKAPVK